MDVDERAPTWYASPPGSYQCVYKPCHRNQPGICQNEQTSLAASRSCLDTSTGRDGRTTASKLLIVTGEILGDAAQFNEHAVLIHSNLSQYVSRR